MKRSVFIVFAVAALLLVSCDDLFTRESAASSTAPFSWGDEKTISVPLAVEAGETIYLVKYNPTTKEVPIQYTGDLRREVPAGYSASMTQPVFSRLHGDSPLPPLYTHHQEAMEFNAAPPPPAAAARSFGLFAMDQSVVYTPPAPNDVRQFWVQNAVNAWVQINAKLVKIGEHCYVWVATGSADNFAVNPRFVNYTLSGGTNIDNKVTDEQVEDLAEKFDLIYSFETDLFGFENGGGGQGGGIDGDPKIHILVYDIKADWTGGSVVGFFWGKDEYADGISELNGLRSNEKEIFYIDAYFLDRQPEVAYSTLVHEFQHMIHFNQKNLRLTKATATWYNEMLSMLAEDTISSQVGIHTSAHPVQLRLPLFNAQYYMYGITEWGDVGSYSQVYAFGAYLVRNYGGAKLLYEMAHNNSVDVDSVDAALKTLTGNAVGFTKALEKFPETLLNMQETLGNYAEGVLQGTSTATFNNMVAGSLWTSPVDLTGYDFNRFDLSDIPNGRSTEPTKGPLIAGVQQYLLKGHGIDVQNCGTISTAGNRIAQLTYHANSPVKMYFLGKKSDGTVTRKSNVYPQ